MLWPTDPALWQPAVDAWTADLALATGPDVWVPVTRSAFGTMHLVGRDTGSRLAVHAARGWIFPARDRFDPAVPDDVDVFDVDDKPLLERAIARLGPVGPDTLYAFDPPLGQGGEPRLEALRITDALPHVVMLAAITERRIFPDVSATDR